MLRLGPWLTALCLAPLVAACGGDSALSIAPRWATTDTVSAAPPGSGTDGRVVVARSTAPGQWETRIALDGRNLEGPFDTLPTAHAPVMIGADVYIVGQVSGRVVRLDLAGQELDFPSLALGATGPMVAAPDGGLRIAANAGKLAIIAAQGADVKQVDLPGVSDSPPAVDASGATFVATDVGEVVGFSAAGDPVFSATVNAPASGVSVTADRVAVGALDGVRVFDRGGADVFTHARGARVVGTRFTADGDLLAWGEDGIVERLGPDGAVRFSLAVGPPIYAEVHELPEGRLAVVDNDGTAYLVSKDGEIVDQVEVAPDESAPPLRQIARGPLAEIFVARGKTIAALDMAFAE